MAKTLEEFQEAQRKRSEYMKAYMARYRKRNPDKVREWRIRQAVRIAEQNGFSVVRSTDTDKAEV